MVEFVAAEFTAADMADSAEQSRSQLWKQVHAQKGPCPACGKVVSMRTLRWKHKCRSAAAVLSAAQVQERRAQLEQRVLRDLMNRIGTPEKKGG